VSVLQQPFRRVDVDIRHPEQADPSRHAYWRSDSVPLEGFGVTDHTGVRLAGVTGPYTDHPVAQAQYGLLNIYSYQIHRNPRFLHRAAAQAQRLIDRHVEVEGAWFYPYPFDFRLYMTGRSLKAPWFSAMAQGQALSLFVALYEQTQAMGWLTAAEHTFASLLRRPRGPDDTAVSHVHRGNLWLEEYPDWPVDQSGHVLNGLLFAAIGVHDYHRVSGSARAQRLLEGVAATVVDRFDDIRSPGQESFYSVWRQKRYPKYHAIHIKQLRYLGQMTGDRRFVRMAEQLEADAPSAAQ
jgi:hypothetical protein